MESFCNHEIFRLKMTQMNTHYEKLFTSSSIIVTGLTTILDENNIQYIIKDKFESARLAGFGEQMNNVEVHVLQSDIVKAKPIVEAYKNEINS